ncbi:hypothetical protein EDB80DRAFT_84853 [Ilyonectria destructans]|nr:hypothetical protein EDB80DRAFT_84853 [Ilyonectria destructans]
MQRGRSTTPRPTCGAGHHPVGCGIISPRRTGTEKYGGRLFDKAQNETRHSSRQGASAGTFEPIWPADWTSEPCSPVLGSFGQVLGPYQVHQVHIRSHGQVEAVKVRCHLLTSRAKAIATLPLRFGHGVSEAGVEQAHQSKAARRHLGSQDLILGSKRCHGQTNLQPGEFPLPESPEPDRTARPEQPPHSSVQPQRNGPLPLDGRPTRPLRRMPRRRFRNHTMSLQSNVCREK